VIFSITFTKIPLKKKKKKEKKKNKKKKDEATICYTVIDSHLKRQRLPLATPIYFQGPSPWLG